MPFLGDANDILAGLTGCSLIEVVCGLSAEERALYLIGALGPGVSGAALRNSANLIQANRARGLAFEGAVRSADDLGAARRIDAPSGKARYRVGDFVERDTAGSIIYVGEAKYVKPGAMVGWSTQLADEMAVANGAGLPLNLYVPYHADLNPRIIEHSRERNIVVHRFDWRP